MDMIDVWSNWEPTLPPYIIEGDQEILSSPQNFVINHNWQEAIQAPDFGDPKDTRLHLGLLPQPFIGDIRRATIYILLLNPGLGPQDYYGEYQVPEYRMALLNNLKQQFIENSRPFIFLDTQFSWHSGFNWWHGKLSKVIQEIASSQKITFASARTRLASQIACIELMPYHSVSFREKGQWLKRLTSVELARKFVNDFVLERVQREEAILIVTRKVAVWDLPVMKGIITYNSTQARAAHLTPDSPGGRAIFERMESKVN
ncbi:MAG: hypothetical protein IAF02_28710 [Anaerolineae bacterium]|nr:hypothetical protein [Anaerolineae bacterium]